MHRARGHSAPAAIVLTRLEPTGTALHVWTLARPRCLGATHERRLRRAPALATSHACRTVLVTTTHLGSPSRRAEARPSRSTGTHPDRCAPRAPWRSPDVAVRQAESETIRAAGVSRRRRRSRVAPRQRGRTTLRTRSPVPVGSRRVSAVAVGVAIRPPPGRDASRPAAWSGCQPYDSRHAAARSRCQPCDSRHAEPPAYRARAIIVRPSGNSRMLRSCMTSRLVLAIHCRCVGAGEAPGIVVSTIQQSTDFPR